MCIPFIIIIIIIIIIINLFLLFLFNFFGEDSARDHLFRTCAKFSEKLLFLTLRLKKCYFSENFVYVPNEWSPLAFPENIVTYWNRVDKN